MKKIFIIEEEVQYILILISNRGCVCVSWPLCSSAGAVEGEVPLLEFTLMAVCEAGESFPQLQLITFPVQGLETVTFTP